MLIVIKIIKNIYKSKGFQNILVTLKSRTIFKISQSYL